MGETPETPDWYDESKVVRAIFAFENGRSDYGGHVVDLGDGTCRFANKPLLGEGGPEWGDRVDLFYHPCAPFDRPMIGYRIYGEGEEPVGRSFGLRREPDEEEIAEHEKAKEARECRDIDENFARMNAPFKAMEAEMKASKEFIRYCELSAWVKDQNLKVPDDLHDEPRARTDQTPEERKDTKLFLLAAAAVDYSDIEVTDDEVQAKITERKQEDAEADGILKALTTDD